MLYFGRYCGQQVAPGNIPSTPSLQLSFYNSTTIIATISGSDAGTTNTLYFEKLPDNNSWFEGPSRIGNGTALLTALTQGQSYLVYVVSSNNGSYSLPAFAYISLVQSTDELSTAVMARFNAYPTLLTYIPGGLWLGEVPENSSQPYAWLEVSTIDTQPLMEGEFEFGRFLIHVFGPGAQNVQTACRQLKAVFDYQQLTFTTKTCVSVIPISYLIRCEALRNAQGILMYRGTLLYRVQTDDISVNYG
jgi:hypothetical protein